MRKQSTIAVLLISSIISSGCQGDPRPTTVSEYRPQSAPFVRRAPDSEVFVLLRGRPEVPVAVAASGPSLEANARPLKQFPVEVEQVYAVRGSPVGFRKQDGQLLGVAGETSVPLIDAHYVWQTQPGTSDRVQKAGRRRDQALATLGAIIVVGVIVAAVGLLVHQNRHTLFDDVFGSN
jgi:hypothetical protein